MITRHQHGRATANAVPVRVRGAIVVLILGLGTVGSMALPVGARAARRAGQPVSRSQAVVTLRSAHVVRVRPRITSRRVAVVSATRPITGEPTALPILGQSTDSAGRLWLRVRLPGRALRGPQPPPTGWIEATNSHRSSTPWHIVINLSSRQLVVYRDGRRMHTFRAIVGKSSTPTPQGLYFVEEDVRMSPSAPGAPFALALSARSHVYTQFDGGPGQIAIHGLAHLPGQPGAAASHGCVRLATRSIAWLWKHIGAGVPVTIH